MIHGGDIYRNKIKWDFSVNVNPLGVPEEVLQAMQGSLLQAEVYPDLLCEKLRGEIARKHGIEAGQIVCGNGASELILALCRRFQAKRALLVAPGFSGYERALRAVGTEVFFWQADEEQNFCVTKEFAKEIRCIRPELIFLTNPGNPSGSMIDHKVMTAILEAAKEQGSVVVVDECFLELTDRFEETLIGPEMEPNLYVLRAFTKSFAIPAIRLGYLVCANEKAAKCIWKQLPEWNVSLPAQSAGVAALQSSEYLEKTRRVLGIWRREMATQIEALGCRVYPGEANYVLFFYAGDKNLYEELLKSGILIRDCSGYQGLSKGYYRVAVKKPEENKVLLQTLAEWIEN